MWPTGEFHRELERDRAGQLKAQIRICGYPHALIQAHEHARMGGLEIEMLEHLLLEEVASRDPATARQARLLKLLGRQPVEENPGDRSDAS